MQERIENTESPSKSRLSLRQPRKHLIISSEMMKKYNVEHCFQITFTAEGLEVLKTKYRSVRGLPAYLHNTLKGRPTRLRSRILANHNLYAWTPDLSAIIVPNDCYNPETIVNTPHLIKDNPEGFALLGWSIDSRLLTKHEWKIAQENGASFRDFLIANDKTKDTPPTYQFFKRTNSQEEIGQLELGNEKLPYLASILDLTSDHIEFLETLQKTTQKHLENTYQVDFTKDTVEMYFHFPYPELTTTLHLHIRVNHGRHPIERSRSFPLQEIITHLKYGKKVSDLILQRKIYYVEYQEMLHGINSIYLNQIKNPFILTSPIIDVNLEDSKFIQSSVTTSVSSITNNNHIM